MKKILSDSFLAICNIMSKNKLSLHKINSINVRDCYTEVILKNV